MKVISIDLEMNNTGKIIELGYVIYDLQKRRLIHEGNSLVNPNESLGVLNNGVHVTEYTGITQEMVDGAYDLNYAYNEMCKLIKKYNCSVTPIQWGDGMSDSKGDHDYLRRQLGLTWDKFIFRPRAWDVKSLYQMYRAFCNKGVASGLVKACEHLNLQFYGRPHRAFNDAFMTLEIFIELGSRMKIYDVFKDTIVERINDAKNQLF